ncbi:MAG: hypothetical protein J6C33_03175 [Lachnospiraceae bacterium]|nr:hypothetical protein [Lachnospiraceae bacterium]
MKKLLKTIMGIFLLLSAFLMALLFFCAWKPETTEKIARALYPERYMTDVSQVGDNSSVQSDGLESENDNQPEEDDMSEDTQSVRKSDADSWNDAEIEADQTADYIAPDEENLSIPQEVAGKNGYQEIEGTDSEIDDPEAEKLENELGVGDTGEGLTFDPLYYPYYAMLDEDGQKLYRQIYANAQKLNQSFAPVIPVSAKALYPVISAVYNDHPELFWVDTAYSAKCRRSGECAAITLSFNRTAKNPERENAAFEQAAETILSGAQGLDSDYDKERYVHDALVRSVEYVRSAEMNQSAYSALVNGRTVCAGYARAFQYLLQRLGIPCYYCTGYAGESHAWNIVCLDGEYYNADVTWDDSDGGTYDYFNKTDADYADTHIRKELSVKLPPCGGMKYRSDDPLSEDGRRSSADAGFTENEILHDMPSYYDDCYNRIMENGVGSYTFSNVIEGRELFEEWDRAYRSEAYKNEYMVEAMRGIGARSCRLNLNVEQLADDRYLITHELELQ